MASIHGRHCLALTQKYSNHDATPPCGRPPSGIAICYEGIYPSLHNDWSQFDVLVHKQGTFQPLCRGTRLSSCVPRLYLPCPGKLTLRSTFHTTPPPPLYAPATAATTATTATTAQTPTGYTTVLISGADAIVWSVGGTVGGLDTVAKEIAKKYNVTVLATEGYDHVTPKSRYDTYFCYCRCRCHCHCHRQCSLATHPCARPGMRHSFSVLYAHSLAPAGSCFSFARACVIS